MPVMGGPELARRLATTRPEMRVLYMSGYTDDAIIHHGVLQEGTAFLEKPFTAEAFGRKLREVISVSPN
jgi:FixJ family two-component response regulator